MYLNLKAAISAPWSAGLWFVGFGKFWLDNGRLFIWTFRCIIVSSCHVVFSLDYLLTACLAESNGSLLPGLWRDSLHVTCRLTACTPGSAPGPTLGNEYGKTLPLYLLQMKIDYCVNLAACRLAVYWSVSQNLCSCPVKVLKMSLKVLEF